MNHSDYPNLFKASDKASNDAQRNYLCVMRIDLISGILGAGIAIYNINSNGKIIIYIFSALFLLLSLAMTIVLVVAKFEDAWYKGRALAESCKTLTWRYITCSEPFEMGKDLVTVKALFLNRLTAIKDEYDTFIKELNCTLLSEKPITDRMQEIRNLPLTERLDIYRRERIEDQIKWYTNKANYNQSRYSRWFAVIILAQSAALTCSIFLIFNIESNWNMVGLFSTIAASAISWLQLKQHQELKQAYTITVFELNQILALSDNVRNEIDLSKFVLDSENAISREHTLWMAQRRK